MDTKTYFAIMCIGVAVHAFVVGSVMATGIETPLMVHFAMAAFFAGLAISLLNYLRMSPLFPFSHILTRHQYYHIATMWIIYFGIF